MTIDAGASNHPFSHFVPRNPQDLAAWGQGRWVSQNGQYHVLVGSSSADTPLSGRVALNFDQGQGHGHGPGPVKPQPPVRPDRPDLSSTWSLITSILSALGWGR